MKMLRFEMVLAIFVTVATCFLGMGRVVAFQVSAEGAARSEEPAQTAPITIPFTLTDSNNLSIQVKLNAEDSVALMFHTGVSEVSLTEAAISRLSNLKFESAQKVTSWGGDSVARVSTANSLQIGKLQWDDVAIWECKHSGKQTDGKFGLDLFKGKIIQVDFDQSQFVLHDKLPAFADQYTRVKLKQKPGGAVHRGTNSNGRFETERSVDDSYGIQRESAT